jgi:hypothetical protein
MGLANYGRRLAGRVVRADAGDEAAADASAATLRRYAGMLDELRRAGVLTAAEANAAMERLYQ